MKPLRIQLEAFGPFGGSQLVDFRQLGARTLFLICGPTGAGKTSVLDGICFALYGEATGASRPVEKLRSDHAPDKLPTRVIFDFELAGKLYRIERSPRQLRPKKRGDGYTWDQAAATLWRHPGDALGDTPNQVLATGFGDVSTHAAKLLGFEASQFRQVVILPQGEFRKFLAADTRGRAEILSTLFETSRYLDLQLLLKQQKIDIEDRLHDSRVACKALLDDWQVSSTAQLESARTAQQAAVQQLEANTGQLAKAAQQAKDLLDAGRSAHAKLEELALAKVEADGIQALEPQVELQRAELANARAAATIADTEAFHTQRTRELADAQRKQLEAQELVVAAEAAHRAAQDRLTAQLARAPKLDATRERLADLRSKAPQAQQLEAARTTASQANVALQAATNALANAERAVRDQDSAFQAARDQAVQAEALAAGLNSKVHAANAADETVRWRQDLTKSQADHASASSARTRLEAQLDQASAALTQTQGALVALNRARLEGQASLLATQLGPGQPCPVCGSADHPSPAEARPDMPSEAQIEAAEAAVVLATQQREAGQGRLAQADTKLESIATRITLYQEQLGPHLEVPISELQAASSHSRHVLAQARQAADGLGQLNQQAAALQLQLGGAQQQLELARTAHTQAGRDQASTQQAVAGLEQGLPDHLRAPGALAAAIGDTEHELKDLEAALEAAQSQASAASAKLAGYRGRLEQAAAGLELAHQRLAQALGELTKRIAEAGFEGPEAYALAKRDAPAMAQLDAAIQAWEHRRAANSTRLERATTAAAGLEPPQLPALEAAEAEARHAHIAQLEQLTTQRGTLASQVKTLASLTRIASAQAQDEQQLTVVGRLANVANGANTPRLSFERFVLASLLDQVLLAANTRLQVMSGGRYSLRRSDDITDRRSHGGLDLEVLDAYTGRARPVSTLSGGEGFEASLSLALGLADTVQSRSGGIHLDAVFVDEGFGSLGQEDLDAVLQSLQDLQVGGRLVGIISHVGELRERIPTRLELSKGRAGSEAHFEVP